MFTEGIKMKSEKLCRDNFLNNILFLFVFLTFPINFTIAQISGISSSKLCVPEATTITTGNFEFEPSFIVLNSQKEFCENGSEKSLAGKIITSSLLFRITVGASDNFEIGTSFSSHLEQIAVGSKYILSNSESFRSAIISGISLPAGNKFIPDTVNNTDDHYSTAIGFIASSTLSLKTSIDYSISYTHIFRTIPYNHLLNYGVGIGHWFNEKLQGILEVNAFSAYDDKFYSGKLSVYPGITYRISPKLLFVFGSQLDIIGKTENKSIGYFSAFTISFN